MIKLFDKGSWRWSLIAIIVLLLVGIVGLTNSMSKQSPLEAHIDKATDFDIVSLEDNQGDVTFDLETLDTEHWTREDFFRLETRILLDVIKHFPREDLSYFKKITIRGITEKTNRVFYTVSVSGDTLIQNNWAEMETFEVPKYVDNYSYSKNWEVVSRAYRVQGTISDMDVTDGKLNSLTLLATKRIRLPNHPVDVEFVGKTLNIVFNEELANAGRLKNRIKEGAEIVVTFAQYAIQPTGETVDGAYLSDIYYVENGEYFNVYEEEVDLAPSNASEFLTKPQVEVPVDLEIVRYEQGQVDEGHKPWKLDPVQVVQDYVYNRVSSKDKTGISFEVLQDTVRVAIVEVNGEKSPFKAVYLKRMVKQDNSGIWSVVGYNLNSEEDSKLVPFKGAISKVTSEKMAKLDLSKEEWKQAKAVFHYTSEEIDNLKVEDFEPIQVWEGSLNNQPFELGLYHYQPFQVLVTSYGEEKRVRLLQDFYYSPWLFYDENVRFQQFSKGVGGSFNIITGEFGDFGGDQTFEVIFGDYLEQRDDVSVGSQITVGDNKVEVLEDNALIVR